MDADAWFNERIEGMRWWGRRTVGEQREESHCPHQDAVNVGGKLWRKTKVRLILYGSVSHWTGKEMVRQQRLQGAHSEDESSPSK